MDVRPIRTDADHASALKEISRLWGAKSGSRDGDKLDVLVTLVEAYENARWPTAASDPIEAIKTHMDMTGRGQADLAELLGSRSRASEVLARRRALTLPMIAKISAAWHLPADLLVMVYPLKSGGDRKKARSRRARAA